MTCDTGTWQIGTNSVGNGTANNNFYIYDSAFRLTVQKGSGNIGIGTTDPNEKLHVNGNIIIGETSYTNAYDPTNNSRLYFNYPHEDNFNYYIGTNKNNYFGDYTKLDLVWHTGIRIAASAKYGGVRIYNNDNLNDANLLFSVGKSLDGIDSYNTLVENGNLGIGTNSPSDKLHVNGNIRADNAILNGDNSSISMGGSWDIGNYHKIMGYNNAKKLEFNYDYGTILADNNNIIFKTGYNESNQTHTERMRINNSGNIIIKSNLLIGESSNPHDSTDTSRLHFGASHANNNYYIGTNKEDYGGNYTKLDIRWHTGVRIGTWMHYGGVRIYNNDNLNSANLLLSIGKNSFNTIVEKGNLGIKNGHIVFGENSTDNIISFNNNKIISPIILSSQHTDLGIEKNISDTTHTSGEVYIELRGTATYKYDYTARDSDNNLYYLSLSTAARGSWGVAFLKYTRQIYPTNDTLNIEFDVSWRDIVLSSDSFYVYICPSTSYYNNDTQGLSIHYFTYTHATNYIEFRYNNGSIQNHKLPNDTTISGNYQRFRILITQDGYIHVYKNNIEFVDRSNNPIVGNYNQIINDLSNINKQSIMFRNNNGGAWAEVRVKNITISNHNTYNSIVIDDNNNLGIGTSSPLEKLDIYGNNTNISMTGTWVEGSYHKIMGHSNSKKLEFNYNDGTILADNNAIIFKVSYNDSNQTHDERMRIEDSGYVGIGTSSPYCPLDVARTQSLNVPAGKAYWTTGVITHQNHNRSLSIKSSGVIWVAGSGVAVTSDSRIKTNIVDVPDNLALEQLRNIPCRYYEYIDKLDRGVNKTIGFIAQEVEDILPMAIDTRIEIIPNVYKVINCNWNSIDDKFSMTSSDLSNVNGIKYRFYVSNETDASDEKSLEVTANNDNTFIFDEKYNNVFCYGSEVNDLKTVLKEKLFTLNFSATQEIDKIQQQHITEIETLKSENIELKEKLSELTNKIKNATTFEDLKNSL